MAHLAAAEEEAGAEMSAVVHLNHRQLQPNEIYNSTDVSPTLHGKQDLENLSNQNV